MTIDSTWLSAFKEEIPCAFTPDRPFKPKAVFVDGQIRLMQGVVEGVQTWDDYIYKQFVRPLRAFLDNSDVVVLAFDNYMHVPKAKCMTQVKRRRNIPVIPFGEHAELPCMVPDSVHWMQCIANRAFKTRVIDLVLLRLPSLLLTGRPEWKRLIIDYQKPVEFWMGPEGRMMREAIPEFEAMGEADVKFTRYGDRYGSLLVDSIDGDSIPIALMHHELRCRQGGPIPKVCVYRMELNQHSDKGEKRKKPDSEWVGQRDVVDKKDKTAEEESGQFTLVEDKKKKESESKRPKRKYEYVDIWKLIFGLKEAIHQSNGRVKLPLHDGHEMGMLISLISLTGTDFSRNLPQISGKTVFSFLPNIWMTLAMSYDPATDQLIESDALDRLVPLIYHTKFGNHTQSRRGINNVLGEIQRSKLSTRSKESMPSVARVACTIRLVFVVSFCGFFLWLVLVVEERWEGRV